VKTIMAPRAEVPLHGDNPNDASQELVGGEDIPVEDMIALLMTSMQDQPENATLVGLALRMLLSFTGEHLHLILALGAITQVFGVIQHHDNDQHLLELSLFLLLKIQAGDLEDRSANAIYQTHRIALVVSAMSTFRDNEAIQKFGALLFCRAVRDEQTRNAYIEAEAVTAMLKAMRKLSSDTDVQCACCATLSNLLVNDVDGRVEDEVCSTEGLSVLIDFLKSQGSHLHSAGSIEAQSLLFACEAISMLAHDRESVKATIVELDGISAILSVIKYQSPSAKLEASKALHFLGDNADVKEAFVAAGGMNTLIPIFKENLDNNKIFAGMCLTFWGLAADHHAIADEFALKGGLAAVFKGMPHHIDDYRIQVFAGRAIGACTAALGSKHVENIILSIPDSPSCIVAAMRKHTDCEDFQMTGCTVLRDLTFISLRICSDIVQLGGLLVLSAAMKRFPLNVVVQGSAVCAVGMIAQAGATAKSRNVDLPIDLIESVKALGCVAILIGTLHRGWKEDTLVYNIIHCLRILAENSVDAKKQIASAGGVELLTSIQEKYNDVTAAEAKFLLHCLEDLENAKKKRTADESTSKK